MKQFILIEEDQLKFLLKEIIREVLAELFPYPSSNNEIKKVYTRDEAAAILKVSPNTVSKYIRQGKLHASVLNGKYRIAERELHRFINGKEK